MSGKLLTPSFCLTPYFRQGKNMELPMSVSNKELSEAIKARSPASGFIEVQIKGITIFDLRAIGSKYWFEYHCCESHDSADAQIWYRSHQRVKVIAIADCDPIAFTTQEERQDNGHQLLYRVQFDDGLESDVFEDELLTDPSEFCRPSPPLPMNSNEQILS